MTITSGSALNSSPGTQYADVARANKDSGDIAKARQSRDSVAEQKAVSELRKDAPAPSGRESEEAERVQESRRQEAAENRVGTKLDVKA